MIAAMHDYLTTCEQAARAGGDVLLDWMDRFAVREKGPADLVTEADLASQQVIREHVLAAFPSHGFLGEEGPPEAEKPFRWIVDPLDGTTNYAHHLPQFCVSVALENEGRVLVGTIYDPVSKECFTAAAASGAYLNGRRISVSRVSELSAALAAVSFPARVPRGSPLVADFVEVLHRAQAVRRMGSSALNLAYLAAGRLDAYWATDTKVWDVAAGWLLVQEAGGVVSNLSGGACSLNRPSFVAAATPRLHQEMLSTLKMKE
jgi:myo-inositol-1(or 4)-monophosphatase